MAAAITGLAQADGRTDSRELGPCKIFVVHPSAVLTDARAHGDGLLAYRYITELAKRGHRVAVACEDVDLQFAPPAYVTLHRIELRSKRGSLIGRAEYALKMRRLFRRLDAREQFDVAHQFNPVFAGLSLGLVGIDIPLVLGPYVAHWPSPRQSPAAARTRHGLNALQQRFASAILISGAAARSRVVSRRVAATNVYAVPYGVDLEMFPHTPLPEGDPAILFMAGFGIKKGVLVLLRAFERVAAQVGNARLVIAGDGPERDAVKAVAAQSAYADRIRFLGAVPRADVPQVFAECTVYCLPSLGEPYGMTLVEAMTTGRPVVATGVGGPADLVDPRGGILVPPADVPALADALVEILSDRQRSRVMGEYNRTAMIAYGWPAVIDRLEAVYADVIRQRGRARPA
jgi:glycosyltransferase involved in cell wall biosynthesis